MNSETKNWDSKSVDTLLVLLDPANPRIEPDLSNAQHEIRSDLLETAKVIPLAKEIVKTRGNMAGERIIVVREKGHNVVLEGNRRVCASQLLLNPRLIPAPFKKLFPAIGKPKWLNRLKKLKADIAPSRVEAEEVITRRHTGMGILEWSPAAKQRRVYPLANEGKSVEEISALLNMPKGAIKNLLRDHYLLERAKSLQGVWNKHEREALRDLRRLPTNPYTRFFTLGGVKETLKMHFDDQGRFGTTLPPKTFDKAIAGIARELLIPDAKTQKTRHDTRTRPNTIFNAVLANDPSLSKTIQVTKGTPKSSAGKGKAAKTDPFFKSLVCKIDNDRLVRLTNEIRIIDYKKNPIAATFLVRAILEEFFSWAISHYRLQTEFRRDWKAKSNNSGREPGHEFTLKFVIKHSQRIFTHPRTNAVLNKWLREKETFDMIIHGQFLKVGPKDLENTALWLNEFLRQSLNRSILV